MHGNAVLVNVLAAVVLAAMPPGLAVGSGTDARMEAIDLPAARTGSIEGTATLRLRPQRRVANRYPGGAGGASRPVQPIPAVAYLKGPVPGGAAAEGGRLSMSQRDTTFVPAVLVVPAGATVLFPNEDSFFHNVFSYSAAKRFDLGRYPRGEAKSVTFDEPGLVKVYCEVHESMRAAVLVTENPYHALVREDGTFTIRNVPAGRHTLVLWHVDLGEVEVSVTVPEGGVVRVAPALG